VLHKPFTDREHRETKLANEWATHRGVTLPSPDAGRSHHDEHFEPDLRPVVDEPPLLSRREWCSSCGLDRVTHRSVGEFTDLCGRCRQFARRTGRLPSAELNARAAIRMFKSDEAAVVAVLERMLAAEDRVQQLEDALAQL